MFIVTSSPFADRKGAEQSMDASLLRTSFDQVAPNKEKFAAAFYDRLFASFPETKQLFAKTDMRKQQATLMAAIAMVVSGVEKGENVVPVLQELGQRHKTYGVTAEHYPQVAQALLETFSEFLGPQWTPEVKGAWVDAYTVIASTMQG
jgi:methyl-accepting chemotaxis protein